MSQEKLLLLPFEGKFLGQPNPALAISEYIYQIDTPFKVARQTLPARQSTVNAVPPEIAPPVLDAHYLGLQQIVRQAITKENPTHIMRLGVALSGATLIIENGSVGYMLYYPQGPRISLDPQRPELTESWLEATADVGNISRRCKERGVQLEPSGDRREHPLTFQPTTCNAVGYYVLDHIKQENAAREAMHETAPGRQACFVHTPACGAAPPKEDLVQYPEYAEAISRSKCNDVYFMDSRVARVGVLAASYALMGKEIPSTEELLIADQAWEALSPADREVRAQGITLPVTQTDEVLTRD